MKGKLYLIPNLLGGDDLSLLPPQIKEVLAGLDILIVENIKIVRRFLVKLGLKPKINELEFFELDKHQKERHFKHYLEGAETGKNIGLISDAGCPAIADPGAKIVKSAHERGITVVPLVGPSSIFLALMASGLNGQNFAFNGYIPIPPAQRSQQIKSLEQLSKRKNQTQIFIETPYRNNKLLASILNNCEDKTRLCIASEITLPTAFIQTKTIREWRVNTPELHKKPTIFLLLGFR